MAVETRHVFLRCAREVGWFAVNGAIVQMQGQRGALSLPPTLRLCRRMRFSGAHAHAWVLLLALGSVLVLALALALVSPAPRPHRCRGHHSLSAQNQGRADPSIELDHPRRLPGYSLP